MTWRLRLKAKVERRKAEGKQCYPARAPGRFLTLGPLSDAEQRSPARRFRSRMGEPRGRLLKRRQPAPDVHARELGVRELLDRRAGRAAQGTKIRDRPSHQVCPGFRRRAGAPFFFGDFSFWASKKKVTGTGAAPRGFA